MKKKDIFRMIKPIIKERLIVKKVKMESNFFDDFNADSLDMTELILVFEEKFDIIISDDKIDRIETVKDLVKIIKKGTSNEKNG